MLTKSFIHCDGIGSKKEAQLWEHGIHSWEKLHQALDTKTLTVKINDQAQNRITQSASALKQQDGAFFEAHMPSNEMWRLYPEFKEKTAFLDIETTGLNQTYDKVTIISIFDKSGVRALVRGKDLDTFPEVISKYSLLVTYNGKCFDMPFLHRHFPRFKKNYAHLDLRYSLARLGYKGGLKGIERKIGIHREGALSMVDGYMAVLLWRAHERGQKNALDTLVRYALEDVLNMKPLLELVYNENVKNMPFDIKQLKSEVLPEIKVPYDTRLIERLFGY
jgi:uncharacterized protein